MRPATGANNTYPAPKGFDVLSNRVDSHVLETPPKPMALRHAHRARTARARPPSRPAAFEPPPDAPDPFVSVGGAVVVPEGADEVDGASVSVVVAIAGGEVVSLPLLVDLEPFEAVVDVEPELDPAVEELVVFPSSKPVM